jgi:hypothetical protein
VILKRKDGRAPLALDLITRECFCNTKSEHRRRKIALENAQHEIALELNFPAVAVEDVKFKSQNNSYQVCCWAREVIKYEILVRAYATLMRRYLVQTGIFVPAWRLYSINLNVKKGPFFSVVFLRSWDYTVTNNTDT